MFLEVFIDPTVLFCVSCIVTPLVVIRETLKQDDVIRYFTEPSMCGALLAIPIVWIIGKILRARMLRSVKQRKLVQDAQKDRIPPYEQINYDNMLKPLTYGERTRARWYLLNGLIIHIFMDGCIGVFKTNKLFADNYAKLDKRYGDPIGVFNGSAVHVVSLMELLVKGPLCVVLYWLFLTRNPMRDGLEFFTCVTQAYGTIVYYGQEIITGAKNLDVDYKLTFTPHYLLYFWFAIFFGCVLYLVVPSYLAYRSFIRIRNEALFYQRHHYSRLHRRSHVKTK